MQQYGQRHYQAFAVRSGKHRQGSGDCALMKTDIKGKLRNADVPRTKPLLPVFEAIVNSFQSLCETDEGGWIEIEIDRVKILTEGEDSEVQRVIVRDNGPGFNAKNFGHFTTSDTLHKVSIGGKGIGRFTWLSVFEKAEIDSTYCVESRTLRRNFTFSPSDDPEDTAVEVEAPGESPVTSVTLSFIKQGYRGAFPNEREKIAQSIVEHCLLLLLDDAAPSVKLIDGSEERDLVKMSREYAGMFRTKFKVEQKTFEFVGLRSYDRSPSAEREHKLHFAAHGRPVTTKHLKSLVPNLKGHTVDENDKPFVYTGFVTGDFLDETVNGNRTDFRMAKNREDRDALDHMFPEPCLDEIKDMAVTHLINDLRPILDRMNDKKLERLHQFVDEHPEYKLLMKSTPDFLDRITPGAGNGEIEAVLSSELHTRKVKMREQSRKVLRKLDSVSGTERQAAVESLMEQIDDLRKSALAEYIAHRRVIIQFLDRSLRTDPDTGKNCLEKDFHSVVFQMQSTSDQVGLDKQNLWLVDERLNYHAYLASDMSLRSMKPLSTTELTRPDLVVVHQQEKDLYDRAHVLAENNQYPLTSFVVVEFKRPLHTEQHRRDENPINQVYDQIAKIRSGDFKDNRGRLISLAGPNVPAYAYIICDLTNDLRDQATYAGLTMTPDNNGYFGFNSAPRINAYVEIISYDKLINDAKKRNRAFFEQLNFDVSYDD